MGRVENIEGKGENAGYQHFLLFPKCFQKASQCFQEASFYGREKLGLCDKGLISSLQNLRTRGLWFEHRPNQFLSDD